MSIAAEVPRILDVRDFAQARETELRYLLKAVKLSVGETRFGAPFLPRHLRRRATSHRRFCVRRRPNLRLAALYSNAVPGGGGGGGNGGGDSSSDRGQAKGIGWLQVGDVRPSQRASEDVKPRAQAGAVQPQRRRHVNPTGTRRGTGTATGNLNARAAIMTTVTTPRNLPEDLPEELFEELTPLLRPTNRRMRRRPGRVQLAVEASCASLGLALAPGPSALGTFERGVLAVAGGHTENHMPGQTPHEIPDGNVAAAGAAATAAPGPAQEVVVPGRHLDPGLRRLETHVWHARRMAMECRWGHLLAAHAAGRGRGSRSLLAQLRCRHRHGAPGGGGLAAGVSGGVLLHDSSYQGCVELRGHQRVLAAVLRRMSDPHHLDSLLDRPELISGAAEWAVFLHCPGAFPFGPLAPVRALWLQDCPTTATTTAATTGNPLSAGEDGFRGGGEKGVEEGQKGQLDSHGIDPDGWARRCALWLWVHAAAFADVWEALHQATAEVELAELAAAGKDGQEDMMAPSGSGGGRRRCPVSIRSRCSDLRRVDVVGEAATAALASVLLPIHAHPHAAGGGSSGGAAAPTVAVVAGSSSTSSADGACGGTCISHYPFGETGDSTLGGRVWWSFEGERGANGARDGPRWRRDWRWPAGAVLGMTVADPRLAAPVRVGGKTVCADALAEAEAVTGRGICATTGGIGGSGLWRRLGEEDLRRQMLQWPEAGDWTAGAAALWRTVPVPLQPQPEPSPATAIAQSAQAPSPPPTPSQAPAASSVIRPPLGTSEVAAVRRTARERLLRAGLGLGLEDAPPQPLHSLPPNHSAPTSSLGGAEVAGGAGISFPVLLIRRPEGGSWGTSSRCSADMRQSSSARARTSTEHGVGGVAEGVYDAAATARLDGPGSGWSLVLPAHWVMPVWIALAFNGARATGQSEWRQLATHFRTPCFPYDHPYTPAGVRLNREVAAEMAAAASQRPRGWARRPTDFWPLADWNRLMQPPFLPVCPLPAALRGGAGDGSGSVLQGEEGPRPGKSRKKVAAVAEATAVAEPIPPGEGAGGRGAGGNMDVDVVGDVPGRGGGAPMCRLSASGSGGCGRSEVGVTQWALALSKRTLQCCLLGSGKGGGQQPVATAAAVLAAVSSGWRGPEAARHVEEMDQQQQQQRGQPQQQRPVQGRQPASKDCLHGWTLRKALRLGLLKQPPHPPPPQSQPPLYQQPTSAPPTAAPTPTRELNHHPHQLQYHTLVYVALRVEGRGVCEAGAEVLGLKTTAHRTPCQGRVAEGGLTRTVTDMDVDVDIVAGPAGAAELDMLPAARAVARREGPGSMVTFGYVISASPRGSPAYPGGLALCDAVGLASQGEGEGFSRGPRRGLGTCSGHGHGLKLWIRNPGTSVLRTCRGDVLLLVKESSPARGREGGAQLLAWN